MDEGAEDAEVAESRAVGIVGVGLLGSAVASVLLTAEYEVIGYDVLAERMAWLETQGGKPAASAADVARRAGVVFTLLPTLASVEEAITGAGGLLQGGGPSTTVIQMSTISPGLALRMEQAVRRHGAAFLDAPVSGTSGMVARRDCVITVGGDRGAYDRCLPILEALAKRVFHVGACGMGSHLKLVTNLIMGLNGVVLAEGLTLARRAGLDMAQTLEILSHGAAASKILQVRGPLMLEGRFDPLMKMDLFLKDIRLMLEDGQELHVPLPLAATMQQLYTAAVAGGRAKEDLSGIAGLYEAMAGLPARRAAEPS
jgi:3-hydroxyisobutyrate dehydrogenase-like beta-hydroxyacid dehydrogenase